MDITNNVSLVNDEINQIGGINNDEISESSDYDVNSSEFKTNTVSELEISEILEGNDNTIDLKNFNISDLNKNPSFVKLSNNQKTLVINRIIDRLPKSIKNIKSNENFNNKESYFYCKSCGYNEKIPNKMFIFSRGNEKKNELYNFNFQNYTNDNTLPYSKNYNCINEKCKTHIDPKLKNAVFFRNGNSYNIKYICSICDSFWDTFIEK